MRTEQMERSWVWGSRIMTAGKVMNVLGPASMIVLYLWVDPLIGLWLAVFLAMAVPFCTGALVSFMGMSSAGRYRNVWDWGAAKPTKCFLYALPAYLLLLVSPLGPFAVLGALVAWLATVAGGLLAAWIVELCARDGA